MRDFDFYEFAGIIAPGMLVVVGGAIILIPDYEKLSKLAELSVGGLGIGLLLAYIAGQLVQTIGNGVEKVWWRLRGGMPSDWVRSGKYMLIADKQHTLLQDCVRQMLKSETFELNSTLDANNWYAITRQVYAAVASANRATRLDVFNGNYGLHRGIASSLLVLLFMVTIVDWQNWKYEGLIVVLIAMAIYRMNRFGMHYGRELFIQFVQLDKSSKK
jgi:hypothetical protein